jgi:DNA mismatch repair protein MLH1
MPQSADNPPQVIYQLVVSKRELIKEYFNMDISEKGVVESIPLLLRRYTPDLDRLPLFLMRLGPQVDWTDEANCFRTIMRELAYLYVPGPLPSEGPPPADADAEKLERWQIQHVLFPAMRKYFVAPKKILDADVVQVASLPDLYRVFERC